MTAKRAIKQKTYRIDIAVIRDEFDVRVHGLDPERVEHFRQIYEAGGKVDPPKVTFKTKTLVEGRHRKAGAIAAGLTSLEVYFIPEKSRKELLFLAAAENEKTSRPLTQADLEFTIRQLLQEGATQAEIYKRWSHYPKAMLRRFIQNAQSRIHSAKVQQGLKILAEGKLNLEQVAKQVGLSERSLKASLSSRRRQTAKKSTAGVKSKLTKSAQSFGAVVRGNLTTTLDRVRDQELSREEAEDIIGHMESQLSRLSNQIKDWRKRLASIKS